MSRNLSRLLRPKSIAVIGGGAWCANAIRQARSLGFTGPVWPVHPSKSSIADTPAFRSIAALPAAPDAAFVGINARATIDTVATLAARGTGGAICFASGFAETGQCDLQNQLLTAASHMPLLGPNCYGFINALDGALLWPDQHGLRRTERGVAIITQSSNIAVNLTMQRRGLPIAYMVACGNQAQTSLADIASELARDPRVTAIGLHIEGITDIAGLHQLATTAHALKKPIIALKIGRSAQARAATISHTASLAGSDAGASALLARLAIPQAHSLPDFLEALKLLHVHGSLASTRIASMSCSGGEASLIADLATGQGVSFPPLSSAQKSNLRTALGPKVALANPLDYHTYIWNDAPAMANTFAAIMTPDIALGVVVADFPRADRCDPGDWDCVIDAITACGQKTGQPMALAATLPENLPEDVAARLVSANVAPLSGLNEALAAIRIAAHCGQAPHADAPLPPRPPKNLKTLTEAQAKSALSAHGLMIPNGAQGSTADLPRLAETLSFPLVLKGQGIAHKTEAGAVVLNLADTRAVTQAAAAMPAETFLLEEMIPGAVAELLIGAVIDPAHGYVLTLGAGGTLTELLSDTASLLIPATKSDVKTALNSLKISKILKGYRSRPAADIDAILDAAHAIQNYVIANHGQISEVEINPLLCLPTGAIAADALIRTGDPT